MTDITKKDNTDRDCIVFMDTDSELWLISGEHKQKLSRSVLPVAFESPGETNTKRTTQ